MKNSWHFLLLLFFLHFLHDSYRHRHRGFFFSCGVHYVYVFLSLSNFHWLIKQLWRRLKGYEIYMCCLLIFFLEGWHWISLNLYWPLSSLPTWILPRPESVCTFNTGFYDEFLAINKFMKIIVIGNHRCINFLSISWYLIFSQSFHPNPSQHYTYMISD